MTTNIGEKANVNLIARPLLIACSLLFLPMVGFGWYKLSLGAGWFSAILLGILMAVIAFLLAALTAIGGSLVKSRILPFLGLLFFSALGIFNTAILYAEGSKILADAAVSAQSSFLAAERAAVRQLDATGATARRNEIMNTAQDLFSEINSPVKCGQGPEARRLISELQRQLPGFEPLNTDGPSCDQREAIIADYTSKIDRLIATAPWNNPALSAVVAESQKARNDLSEYRRDILANYNPVQAGVMSNRLEAFDERYINARNLLEGSSLDDTELPDSLDLAAARGLGKFSNTLTVFVERFWHLQTWLLLIFALLIDAGMVALIWLAAKTSTRTIKTEVPLRSI